MPVGYYRGFDQRDYYLKGSPAGTFNESFPHDQATSDLAAALVSGVMTSVACPLLAGDVISTMSVLSGATAMVTPSHFWMALYNGAGVLMGQSLDVPAQVVGANAVITHTFQSPITIPTSGVYFAAIMAAAVTVPTLIGKICGATVGGMQALATAFNFPNLAQSSGSALIQTAPPTIVTPTAQNVVPFVILQ